MIPLFRAMTQGREPYRGLDQLGLTRVSDIELRALPAFVWLRMNGVPFDQPAWEDLAALAAQEKARLGAELEKVCPQKGQTGLFGANDAWNWDSPQQVVDVLNQLGCKISSSVDHVLATLNHPAVAVLRKHREQATLLKMYGLNWLEGADIQAGRVYADWRQIGTATGRTSCKRANFQQIPRDKRYRKCVKAPPGRVLVKCDFSTLQMRIAAKWAKDQRLIDIFKRGLDPHTETAKFTLGKDKPTKDERQIAKSQNFGLLFGMGAEGLQVYARTTYGVSFTLDQAKQLREKWFVAYPGFGRWHQETKRAQARESRCTSGRRRVFHQHTPDTERLNTPVQGDESDGLKLALALLWERRTQCPGAFPVLAVHDEIVVESDEERSVLAKNWLEDCMIQGMTPWLDPVPVAVESKVLGTWGD